MKTNKLFFMVMLVILGGVAKMKAQYSNCNTVFDATATTTVGTQNNVVVGTGAGASMKATPGTNVNYRNVFLGIDAGRNSNTLSGGGENARNTYLGFLAGYRDASRENVGSDNVFVGHQAGYLNTTGEKNVIIQSVRQNLSNANVTGSENCIIGFQSGEYISDGSNNSFFGSNAGRNNTTGSFNAFLGPNAGSLNTIGSRNIFVTAGGTAAALAEGIPECNIMIGNGAAPDATGKNNVVIGSHLNGGTTTGLTTGSNNLLLGRVSLSAGASTATTLGNDTNNSIILANGNGQQRLIISGTNGFAGFGLPNNIIPQNMLEVNSAGGVTGTTGLRFRNFVNPHPGTLTTATTNKVLSVNGQGDVVLVDDLTGTSGNNDDWHLTGNVNTSPSLIRQEVTGTPTNFLGTIGDQDLVFRRNGIRSGLLQAPSTTPPGTRFMSVGNTAFGVDALSSTLLTGGSNTALGVSSLVNTTTGIGNVAIGTNSLMNSRQDIGNVAIGYGSLIGLTTQAAFPTTTWLSNIALGTYAGANLAHGNNNVFIGVDAGPIPLSGGLVNAFNHRLYIDGDVTNVPRGNNTPLIYGEFDNRNIIFNLNNENNSANLTSRVTINSGVALNPGTNPLASSASGLRFADMNNTSPSIRNTTKKVLSVDGNALGGDVILVNDRSLYDEDGTIVTPSIASPSDGNPIPGLRTVTMGNNNLFFNTTSTDFADGTIGKGRIYIGNGLNFTPLATTPVNSHYRLLVEGGILTEKVKVALNGTPNWSDYIFANDYKLMPLTEIESFVKENKHLPGIESAETLVKNGLDLGDMQSKQMGKIEELTLYAIEQEKKIEKQGKEIEELKAIVKTLLEKK